jgi:hypothetical protein
MMRMKASVSPLSSPPAAAIACLSVIFRAVKL